MGSKRPGSDEENQSDTETGCKHFSSGYLGNPWKCQKDPDASSLLKGMTRSIFHKDFSQSSCICGSVLQVNAGSPLLQPSQQLTRTMAGQWAPGLHGSSNRSVVFSRALHTPQALSLPLLPCGTVWLLCGVFPGMWQFQPVRMAGAQQGCIWGCTK